MALQIAQWNLNLGLSTIPTNRQFNVVGSDSILLLPTNKNVLIKYIALDSIYNQSGDICIKDFTLNFSFFNFNNIQYEANNPIVSTGLNSQSNFYISLNKQNPFKTINKIFGGLNFFNSNTIRNSIVLNNSSNPINSTATFLLSIYYAS